MECDRTLEIMAVADTAMLEGALSGSGELARHLAECPACADAARAVLEQQTSLAEQLAAVGPSAPLDRALQMAGAEAERRNNAGRRRYWRGLAPLAAAATVAGLLAIRFVGIPSDGVPGEGFEPTEIMVSALRPDMEVTAPEGTNVAVFRTPNPDIVVYWFYEGGEVR